MSQVTAGTVNGSALSEVDRLFASLDGATVPGEFGIWHSRIQGIFADGPYIWLQLQRDEDDAHSAVLRLPRTISLDALMALLPTIRFDDESSPYIVRVPQVG